LKHRLPPWSVIPPVLHHSSS